MYENISKIDDLLQNINTLAISGHVRPDGDCVGSCLGLYNYIRDNYADIDVTVFLESIGSEFEYLNGFDKYKSVYDGKKYDLWVSLDTGSESRIGVVRKEFERNSNTLCIDHHPGNRGFAGINYIIPTINSCCEVLYGLFDEDKISKNTAEALYTGMIHDTGVFKYAGTTERTMEIAGKLMSRGIDFTRIIDDGFYTKSYKQNQILGRALLESMLIMDKRCIVSSVSRAMMKFYGVDADGLGGIVEQLRLTAEVECAIFLYETDNLEYKVSLRSKKLVDVNRVAQYFGGGGHVRAAGCIMKGTPHDVINNLTREIEKQIGEG